MNRKIIAVGLCAFAFVACDQLKTEQKQIPATTVSVTNDITDDQKFSYMLGTQFAGPSFANIAVQLGEYFDVDYLIQGIYDNSKSLKDTSFKLQINQDSLSIIDQYFADVSAKRVKQASPDSATEMSFNGDINKLRAYVDSSIRTLPIQSAAPIKNTMIVIDESSSMMQKYSYIMGMQLHIMFRGVERQFDQEFDIDYFVQGAREACKHVLDTNFVSALSTDTLKAVNDRYVVKVKEVMRKKREEYSRMQTKAAEEAEAQKAEQPAAPADAQKE